MKIEIFKNNWSVSDVASNPDKIFVFGDNNARVGRGGQAIIRDLPNSVGIRTKKEPSDKLVAYYKDSEYDQNTKNILSDILEIKSIAIAGSTIVMSKGGYGNGLAKLKEKAPNTFKFLCDSLKEHFNFDNENGNRYYKVPSNSEITTAPYVSIDSSNKDILTPINNSFFIKKYLSSNINTIYDLFRLYHKVSFTSRNTYNPGQVLILSFNSPSNYIVCRVSCSYPISDISDKNWSVFEGFDNSFISSISDRDYIQTHVQFICTLDDTGNMIFKDDIFGGIDKPKVDINKKKLKK